MSKKWNAKCDSIPSYLWLRNKIFYYRFELPRVDGKRRYKRISLHTSNFFEAREKIRMIKEDDNWPFNEIHRLFNNLIFEKESLSSDNYGVTPKYKFNQRGILSKFNKKEDVDQLLLLSGMAESLYKEKLVNPENLELIKQVNEIKSLLEKFSDTQNTVANKVTATPRTIFEVLETMLLKGNNCQEEQKRKKNTITKLLAVAGLKLEDDYSKFHTTQTIETISKHIIEQADTKGDMKRKLLRYIKELANCGTNIDPDNFKSNVILNLPRVEKTKKSERNPHKPYTQDQLLQIFNPQNDYFKENQDTYFVCLIALFTGARINSALTLQYDDIVIQEGIDCIYFRENHPIKKLKNEASERLVPIHNQLIKAGFLEYVNRNKLALHANGTDFIFPRCITTGNLYNNKYVVRFISNFFIKIGVKSKSKDGLDFHSFRKNASIIMQDSGISQSYINDIIGWEGKNTMEQSYSNHSLAQIKEAMSKFNYDFLQSSFDAWKKKLGL